MAKRKRRLGDRNDGWLLRSIEPYNKFTPFIMKDRNDALVNFSDSIDIEEAEKFLRRKRLEGFKGMGYLHLFLAAYVRIVSQRPIMNRFIAGQRIYARNSIEVVMTVKRELSSEAPETSIKVKFEPADTIEDVYRRMKTAVEEAKNEDANGTDKTAALLTKMPRLILRFAVGFLKLLDYFGLLPKALLDVSPFHGSLVITDLGSLGIPPVYHHIYNFGNLPMFVALGAKRRVLEPEKDGTVRERKYLDFTLVADERICDGFNYAKAFKYLRTYLRRPELLETPPETVVEDVD